MIDEDYMSYGVTAEILASVAEEGVVLKAPPKRVAYPDIPIPFSRPLEQFALPDADAITDAARELMTGAPTSTPASS